MGHITQLVYARITGDKQIADRKTPVSSVQIYPRLKDHVLQEETFAKHDIDTSTHEMDKFAVKNEEFYTRNTL